jgi:hypothetical protein
MLFAADAVSIFGRYPVTGLVSQLVVDMGLYLYNNSPAGTYASAQAALDRVW